MNNPKHMFWTGGWDSTFHLLDLIVQRKLVVQPHYVIDEDRRSTLAELKTLRDLRGMIESAFPHNSERILPTRFVALSDLKKSKAVAEAYKTLKQRFPTLGAQYEWMTQYCAQEGLTEMRVCAEKAPEGAGPVHIYNLLTKLAIEVDDAGYTAFRVPAELPDRAAVTLFGRYLLPLLDTTKLDMASIAETQQWTPIMGKTWFCHWPTARMKPCGRCNPCLQVAADGLSWRLPWRARIASLTAKGY